MQLSPQIKKQIELFHSKTLKDTNFSKHKNKRTKELKIAATKSIDKTKHCIFLYETLQIANQKFSKMKNLKKNTETAKKNFSEQINGAEKAQNYQ